MSLTIRPAALADIPTLLKLMEPFTTDGGYPFDEVEATASFNTLLSNPALGGVFLAEIAGEAAGYVVLTMRFAMEYGGLEGYLDDLYVRPAVRRQGVAHALLEALFADCRQRDVKGVAVEAGQSNHAAQKLYASFGLHGWTDDREVLVRDLR
ncbi:MAG: GNAT family N-acetyltransferase [Anaerolineales bacterium]|nr:GNAT family N-acetyltransferase [Anaerolineales bacterium]